MIVFVDALRPYPAQWELCFFAQIRLPVNFASCSKLFAGRDWANFMVLLLCPGTKNTALMSSGVDEFRFDEIRCFFDAIRL